VERCRSELRSGLANIEAHYGPLATVLELCNETWMHTMLSEHPVKRAQRLVWKGVMVIIRPSGHEKTKPNKANFRRWMHSKALFWRLFERFCRAVIHAVFRHIWAGRSASRSERAGTWASGAGASAETVLLTSTEATAAGTFA